MVWFFFACFFVSLSVIFAEANKNRRRRYCEHTDTKWAAAAAACKVKLDCVSVFAGGRQATAAGNIITYTTAVDV